MSDIPFDASTATPPPLPNDGAQGGWFYERNGQRIGPVAASALERDVRGGRIAYDALLWHSTLGDWTPVGQTRFARFMSSPPPLKADRVNSAWAWLLAFAPILGVLLAYFVAGFVVEASGEATAWTYDYLVAERAAGLWWLTVVMNIVFASLDSRQVERAGHESTSSFWAVVLVPAYLFIRNRRIGTSQLLLIVWCVAFGLSFFA